MRKLACVTVLFVLFGCKTTSIERPIFTPAEIQIILEEAQIAVDAYLKVVVPDPTPEQQLASSLGRAVVRLAVLKLREAGMYADAMRLEKQAGIGPMLE